MTLMYDGQDQNSLRPSQILMQVRSADSNERRLNFDLPLAASRPLDIMFDLNIFLPVVAGCSHDFGHIRQLEQMIERSRSGAVT